MKALELISEEWLWDNRLAPLLGYLPKKEKRKVREALSLAYDAHSSQTRKSGEPFITHPVEVTRILAELKMDYESLVAGLLHDTVEDCGELVGLEEIEFSFGLAVKRIVEGETKFSKLPTHHPERIAADTWDATTMNNPNGNVPVDPKAQDLQFLFLAMTEEVRIIVVKLADRLHNMRTMASMPPGKQRRIAQETLTVFAPLARLLGLYTIKEELEELSFMYAMPAQYALMAKAVDKLWQQQCTVLECARVELTKRLESDQYLMSKLAEVKVEINRKALYSLWRKLQESGKSVKDVAEISQLMVTLEPCVPGAGSKQLCYHVMGLVHSFWAPIPGGVKDYIATPKSNNYQSLHTSVLPTGLSSEDARPPRGPGLFAIEIQIKTKEMQRLAEYGIAVESWSCADCMGSSSSSNGNGARVAVNGENGNGAYITGNGVIALDGGGGGGSANGKSSVLPWGLGAYLNKSLSEPAPSNGAKLDSGIMSRRINWLNSIRQWQEEFVGTLTAQEFVDCITDDLLGQGVFVFTPSGQVTRLPKGATVVDFAYHIHTDIGNTMVAAKVNGKVVPASHELANAEVVEVITYKGPVNATIIKRHAQWLEAAKTKSSRHKIAKFLKEHAAMAASKGLEVVAGDMCSQLALSANNGVHMDDCQVTWLVIYCNDRAGLLADVANAISKHRHNICAYSGSADVEAALFVMEYELEGPMARLESMVDDIASVPGVQNWASGCWLPSAKSKRRHL